MTLWPRLLETHLYAMADHATLPCQLAGGGSLAAADGARRPLCLHACKEGRCHGSCKPWAASSAPLSNFMNSRCNTSLVSKSSEREASDIYGHEACVSAIVAWQRRARDYAAHSRLAVLALAIGTDVLLAASDSCWSQHLQLLATQASHAT